MHDLSLLVDAAKSAGRVALGYWKGTNKVWEKGPDDPVSEADYAVDSHLREILTAARPDYGWLSEESDDSGERLGLSHVFVVDPIDGTRAFIDGRETWAHSIAVVANGRPVAGVVFLPAADKLYAATTGGHATLNGAPLDGTVATDLSRPLRVLSNRAAFEPHYWPGGVPDAERAFRPSLAYRLCLVAEGRFDAMMTFRDSWEWDIAAGSLIAASAGCTVTDRDGRPITFNMAPPKAPGILVGSPAAHRHLLAARGMG